METPTETKLRKEVANLLFSKILKVSDAVIAQQAPASRLDYLFACYEHNWATTKRSITCPHCAQKAQGKS